MAMAIKTRNGVDLSLIRENLKLTPVDSPKRKLERAAIFFKRTDRKRELDLNVRA